MHRRQFLVTATAFAAAAVATITAARADTRIVNAPGDGFLNLRTGPGTNFEIIRPMYHGSTVETLEWAGGWVRVRHESGATGWCSAKYLARAAPPPQVWRYVYSPGDGYLNLRTGPGTNYRIVLEMYNGEPVEVIGRSGNWLKVRHQSGATGWAYARYLVE